MYILNYLFITLFDSCENNKKFTFITYHSFSLFSTSWRY